MYISRQFLFILLVLLLFQMSGAGAGTAINPELNKRVIFGLWECEISTSGLVYVTDLIPPSAELIVDLVDKSTNGTYIAYELDITLRRSSAAGFPEYPWFDVQGVILDDDNNVYSAKDDPDLMWIKPGGCRLDNADGWTRWCNQVEFPLEAPAYSATLNPYKYFANALWPEYTVIPTINRFNRGKFSANSEVKRKFMLRFPKNGDDSVANKFLFAAIASWAEQTATNPPPEANRLEAYHIKVDSSGSYIYINPDTRGGNLVLDLQVFDWGAPANDIDLECYAIRIVSEQLFPNDIIEVPLSHYPADLITGGRYPVVIPNVQPSGPGAQDILITVVSNPLWSYRHTPGAAYPANARLAAYWVESIMPDTVIPPQANGSPAAPITGPAPLAIRFADGGSYDELQRPAVRYEWNFGDCAGWHDVTVVHQGIIQPGELIYTYRSSGSYIPIYRMWVIDGDREIPGIWISPAPVIVY